MTLRLLAAASLFALLMANPATAQDFPQECADAGLSTWEDCNAMMGGGAAEEPVYEEPAYEEPAPEPVYEEPAYEEPAPEPVYEEPAYEEPAPEPVYEEPAYEEPAPEPVYEEPAYEEPVIEEPAYEEPVQEEEIYEEEAAPEEEILQEEAQPEESYEDEVVPEDEIVEEETAPEDQVIEEEAAPEDEIVEDDVTSEDAIVEEETSSDDAITDEEITSEDAVVEDETSSEDAVVDEETATDDEQGIATENLDEQQSFADEALEADDAPITEEDALAMDEAGVNEEPMAQEALPADEDPLAELPAEELFEATEPLPEGASEEEASPIFDSAKSGDYDAEEDTGEDTVVPESDEDAQMRSMLSVDEIVSASADEVDYVALEEAPPYAPGGDVTIINNVENTYIYEVNNQIVINNVQDERSRIYGDGGNEIDYVQLGDNRFRETAYRDDGSYVVTTRDIYGNVLERYVVDAYGNSYVLAYFDPTYYEEIDYVSDPGYRLPPLRLKIPLRDYVLDWRYADANAISTFFRSPPVEQVRRTYSIDEVKRSARLRDSVRRLEVNDLNFASGSAELSRNQINALERLANAMLTLLADNPGETFLIEGHTDAKGSDQANLLLSDRRASQVARILTQYYGVPAENLATQGYGERYLRVNTQRAEPQNRRVTVRRITPLVTPYFASR